MYIRHEMRAEPAQSARWEYGPTCKERVVSVRNAAKNVVFIVASNSSEARSLLFGLGSSLRTGSNATAVSRLCGIGFRRRRGRTLFVCACNSGARMNVRACTYALRVGSPSMRSLREPIYFHCVYFLLDKFAKLVVSRIFTYPRERVCSARISFFALPFCIRKSSNKIEQNRGGIIRGASFA